MPSLLKKLLVFPPILAAIAIVAFLQNRPLADAQEPPEVRIPARVLTVAPVSLVGTASGFGRVQATRIWSGVAEVEGRLVTYSNSLQPGALVRAGDTLFEIDARDYEIAVAQAQADVQRAEADLRSVTVNAENAAQSLSVELEILKIYKSDMERVQTLVERGSVAAAQLEDANRTFLSQQSVVASLESTLALVEPDTLSAEASLAKARADLESAQRDLARTKVVAPFDARVTERGASLDEYVRAGDVLVALESLLASEVTAAIQPADLARLFGTLSAAELLARAEGIPSTQRFEQIFGSVLSARVVAYYGDDVTATWPARLTRLTGSIEEETGSIGVVVRIENAARPNPELRRPALVNGSFVEVVLTGPRLDDLIALPLTALRYDGTDPYVFVADAADRLARLDVSVGAEFDGQVIISDGVPLGSRVVLSDPRPATVGLLLEPIDVELAE
ncbi:MAG: HlyD family efflux transporter periplasmic adaptor subunit [Pseudomonadota bacterium]